MVQLWHAASKEEVQAELSDATSTSQPDPHLQLYNQAMLAIRRASAETAKRRYSQAEELYRRSIQLCDQLVSELPHVSDYRYYRAWTQDHLAKMLSAAGRHNDATREYQTALQQFERLATDFPQVVSYQAALAWFLAYCPESSVRQPLRAIELAKDAIDRVPVNARYWNTLGVAHYRADDWQEAITALTNSVTLEGEESAYDCLFLAMSHWQLGNQTAAREWHQKALRWMDANTSIWSNDLQVFDEEARELLGLPEDRS